MGGREGGRDVNVGRKGDGEKDGEMWKEEENCEAKEEKTYIFMSVEISAHNSFEHLKTLITVELPKQH